MNFLIATFPFSFWEATEEPASKPLSIPTSDLTLRRTGL